MTTAAYIWKQLRNSVRAYICGAHNPWDNFPWRNTVRTYMSNLWQKFRGFQTLKYFSFSTFSHTQGRTQGGWGG